MAGEEDAADNRKHYSATYCHYLLDDMAALIDHLRKEFPGASPGTPFIDGGSAHPGPACLPPPAVPCSLPCRVS